LSRLLEDEGRLTLDVHPHDDVRDPPAQLPHRHPPARRHAAPLAEVIGGRLGGHFAHRGSPGMIYRGSDTTIRRGRGDADDPQTSTMVRRWRRVWFADGREDFVRESSGGTVTCRPRPRQTGLAVFPHPAYPNPPVEK